MNIQIQPAVYEILKEYYNLELEPEDACDSYEILISDISLIIEGISENIDKTRYHLKAFEDVFCRYCELENDLTVTEPGEVPWN